MTARRISHSPRRMFLLTALLLITGFLAWFGRWRGTATGPQVQVPMFYDDHYIYPRPWTQAQEAPGIPDPAPLAALYGPNRLSQPFAGAAGQLSVVELWVAGPAGTEVELSLAAEDGSVYGGVLSLAEGNGRFYRLSVPTLSLSGPFILTLAAPAATAEQPVVARAVGGDRLGGSLMINEYRLPGNLELYTYGRGDWLNSLGEQFLPAVFRLRLQQYKPGMVKGAAFPVLLGLTISSSILFLLLAAGGREATENPKPKFRILDLAMALWLAFLLWQIGSGRLLLPGLVPTIPLQAQQAALAAAPDPDGQFRLVQDFSQSLWTAVRRPEARFISTGLVEGLPSVIVPADSAIEYPLTLPFDGRLRLGMGVQDGGVLRFTVLLGQQPLHTQIVNAASGSQWLELDLQVWGGQPGPLILQTEQLDGPATGYWLMPQLWSASGWLLAGPLPAGGLVQSASERFGESVELAGYQVEGSGEQLVVTLYWRPLAAQDGYATVFVHLLDEAGNIVAQDDAPPVSGTYPLPAWQVGTIIVDRHILHLPAAAPDGPYRLAVGLYDPVTLVRWPVTGADGALLPDGRTLFVVTE